MKVHSKPTNGDPEGDFDATGIYAGAGRKGAGISDGVGGSRPSAWGCKMPVRLPDAQGDLRSSDVSFRSTNRALRTSLHRPHQT
eukprot:gene1416-biopygen4357